MTGSSSTITYFIYARKSEENDERQVQSIGDQVRNLERLAKERDLSVREVFTEEKSATTPFCRPVFEGMLKRIKKGEAQGILVWHPNRLARNQAEAGQIEWLLSVGEIQEIRTPERSYLPSDNVLLLAVEMCMATQYSRDLSKNVKRGLYSKAEKGWMPGIAPLGYLNTKQADRGINKIITDTKRFPLLRRAFDLMLTGNYMPDQILRKLNEEWGFRTRKTPKLGGKPLSRSTLYKIFTNPFYMGIFEYSGKTYRGSHEPMVTPEEFDRVQSILGRDGRPRYKQHSYAYTGLMNCTGCGGRISATTVRKKTGTEERSYVLYFCPRARRDKSKCRERRYINVTELEQRFKAEIGLNQVNPRVLDWALEILAEDEEGRKRTTESVRDSKEMAIEDTRKQLSTLTSLRLRELVDDGEYEEQRGKLKADLAKLEQGRDVAEVETARLYEVERRLLDFVRRGPEFEAEADSEVKREVLSTMCLNCTVSREKTVLQTPKWLQRLKEGERLVEQEMRVLEPMKGGSVDGRKGLPEALRPCLRALVEDIRFAVEAEADEIYVPK